MPAGDHLFKVRDEGRKLNEEQADAFHHTIYQLLFVANQAKARHSNSSLYSNDTGTSA